jgi:hypothetical protein
MSKIEETDVNLSSELRGGAVKHVNMTWIEDVYHVFISLSSHTNLLKIQLDDS